MTGNALIATMLYPVYAAHNVRVPEKLRDQVWRNPHPALACRRILRVWLLSSAASVAMAAAAAAQPVGLPLYRATVDVHAVRAASVVDLIRFIRWPRQVLGPGQPVVIGIFQNDPLRAAMEACLMNDRAGLHLLCLTTVASLDDLPRCHVLVMSGGAADIRAALSRVAGRPVLTIGDSEDFIALGGHIQFSSWPCSHFEVSNEHLRASGLSAWSQLLRISGAP